MSLKILCCIWQSWHSFSSGNSGPESKQKFEEKKRTHKNQFCRIFVSDCRCWCSVRRNTGHQRGAGIFVFSTYMILSLQHHWELFLFLQFCFSISMAFVTCIFTFFCSFHFYAVYDSVEVDWHAQRLSTCFVYARTVQLLCRPAVCRVCECVRAPSEWWCLFLGH